MFYFSKFDFNTNNKRTKVNVSIKISFATIIELFSDKVFC